MTKDPATKRTVEQRIVHAEAMASRYLGNYNASLEADRASAAEKWLAKAQYWLDIANDLRGWGE